MCCNLFKNTNACSWPIISTHVHAKNWRDTGRYQPTNHDFKAPLISQGTTDERNPTLMCSIGIRAQARALTYCTCCAHAGGEATRSRRLAVLISLDRMALLKLV